MPTLQDKKAELAKQIRSMADKANDLKQTWTPDDEESWKRVNEEFDNVQARLGIVDQTKDKRMIGREDRWGTEDGKPPRGTTKPSGPMFRNAETGAEIRSFAAGESLADSIQRDSDEAIPQVGAVLAALLTGNRDFCGVDEMRGAMIGAGDTTGGYLLSPLVGGQVVDLARAASVALRAGAVTLPMSAREMTVARLTQDPTAYWRSESARITASAAAFDAITLRAKTLAAIVPVSVEMVEDASNIVQVITNALQAALASELDRAVLLGTGAENEPRGIKNQAGVGTVTSVGTPTDYSKVGSAVEKIYTANYPGEPSGLAWIMAPREAGKFDSLEDTTGQPLQPTPWAAALRRLVTTSLPITEVGGAESSMIVGDFSQCVIGMRTSGVRVDIFDTGTATDGTDTFYAAQDLLKIIRVYLRADVTLLRPSWFTVMSGVTTG